LAGRADRHAAQSEFEPRIDPPAISADDPDVVLAPRLAEISEAAHPRPCPSPSSCAAPMAASAGSGPACASRWASLAALLALLGLQIALHFHDALAAQYPQARPGLQALCKLGGCELRPWRRIDAISVETSALSQAGAAISTSCR